ncbi:MAG: hypothetical protein Satyrvirus1_30 [Satyrvirus sp.]|uniref:Uncharacterized protein n=1 Tax=Satyrvirus sp. TaxID=2487771 RepID=A0A3G5AEC0_9VIRU|nr:MAG: hypothetical protein Satyrvirus1_30 [Satyrvirus sp.]
MVNKTIVTIVIVIVIIVIIIFIKWLSAHQNSPNKLFVKTNKKIDHELPDTNCYMTRSISEYCVDKYLKQNYDLDSAISLCKIPPKIGLKCSSQQCS